MENMELGGAWSPSRLENIKRNTKPEKKASPTLAQRRKLCFLSNEQMWPASRKVSFLISYRDGIKCSSAALTQVGGVECRPFFKFLSFNG